MAKSNDLDYQMRVIMKQVIGSANSALEATNETAAKKTLEALKQYASRYWGSSTYPRSFKSTKRRGTWKIWSPTKYRLVHLLEKGHRIVVHGVELSKNTKARPHMRLAEAFLHGIDFESIYEASLKRELEKNN